LHVRCIVEDPEWKRANELFSPHLEQAGPNASAERRTKSPEPEKVRQTRSLPGAIEIELVTRVLAMDVTEGVVGVLLVMERSNARAFESSSETQTPAEGGLDIERESSSRSAVRRELCMEVVASGAKGEKSALLTLEQHDASDHAQGADRIREWPTVFEPHRYMEPDWLARQP
jgi:hypothetical protein